MPTNFSCLLLVCCWAIAVAVQVCPQMTLVGSPFRLLLMMLLSDCFAASECAYVCLNAIKHSALSFMIFICSLMVVPAWVGLERLTQPFERVPGHPFRNVGQKNKKLKNLKKAIKSTMYIIIIGPPIINLLVSVLTD